MRVYIIGDAKTSHQIHRIYSYHKTHREQLIGIHRKDIKYSYLILTQTTNNVPHSS